MTGKLRLTQELRRKDSCRAGPGTWVPFKRAGGGGGEEDGEWGREGGFCATQTSDLSIDPWRNRADHHYGSICELGDKTTVPAKRLPALPRGARANLVSSPSGL